MSHTGDCDHLMGPCTVSPGMRANRVHGHMVDLIGDLIADSGRTPDDVATEAGVMPSHLRYVLARVEVLYLTDLVGLGEVLGFRPSDLVRLAESRLGTEAVTE